MTTQAINYTILFLILISVVIAAQITSFVGQADPFNISFSGGDNYTFFLEMPLYAYMENMTLSLDPSPVISFFNQTTDQTNYSQVKNFTTVGDVLLNMTKYIRTSKYFWTNEESFTHIVYNLSVGTFQSLTNRYSISTCNRIYNYTLSAFNYTSSQWKVIVSEAIQPGICKINTTNVSMNFATDGVITVNSSFGTSQCTVNLAPACDGHAPYANQAQNLVNYTWLGFKNTTINDPHIEIGNPNNIYEWSKSGLFDTKTNVTINSSSVNNILDDGCGCTDCTLTGTVCSFPSNYYSALAGNLSVGIANVSIFTNLTINIFDQIDRDYIDQLVDVNVFGGNNYSTSTGIINDPFFSTDPGPYSMTAVSNGYVTDLSSFTLTDQDSKNVSIFLFNATSPDAGLLIVQIFDEFYNLLVGSDVRLSEYEAATDSFIEVSQCFSNSVGECIFNVELNTKFYIVKATYTRNDEALSAQSTTNGELIKIDNTVIELHLLTSGQFQADDDFDLVIIPTNTSLIGNTSYLRATFNDPNNFNHTVCISYSYRSGTNRTLINETCLSGSSGVVGGDVAFGLNRSFTWIANIYTKANGIKTNYFTYVYDALTGTFLSSLGVYAKIILLFLVLGSLALALYMKNIIFFGVATIPLAFFTLTFAPNIIGGVTTTFIILLGLNILYLGKKKRTL